MLLTEKVKAFFRPHKTKKMSSTVNPKNVLNNLSDENGSLRLTDFFDYQEENLLAPFSEMTQEELVQRQMIKIKNYRACAMQPEVSNAIDIITNEIIFAYEGFPLKLNVEIDNEALVNALQKAFDKIVDLGNFDKNLFEVVKKAYIDGQLIIHCQYDKSTKKGIQKLRQIEPCGLYFDFQEKVYKYVENSPNCIYFNQMENETYSPEEIVRMDFGLYEDNWLCLSYLEYSLKLANMLRSLEDLLIPLRFSRSVARRVFNVDVGKLPPQRAEAYMKEVQGRFKYKKFYNNETGEISNQQHITSLVEDYWFSNRGGDKGVQVDTLDETQNLGEITDILYLNRKLYRSLHIPMSHLNIDEDADHAFAIDATETTQEDLQFMCFISRLRKVYSQLFKDLLKREVVSTGIMKEDEWDRYNNSINIDFTNENLFIEKMKIQLLNDKIEAWDSIKEIGGTVMPFKELMKRTFGLTENQVNDYLNDIEEEKKSGKFDIFYQLADIELGTEAGLAGMTDAEGNPMTIQDLAPKVFTDPEDFDENPWPGDSYDDEEQEGQSQDSEQSNDSGSEESKGSQGQEQQNPGNVGGFDISKDYSKEQELEDYLNQFKE